MMVRTAPVRPRIAITGIGVVSPFGVGRERYWDHVSRGVQRHARDRRVRRLGVRLPGRGVRCRPSPSTMRLAVDGDDVGDGIDRADPQPLLAGLARRRDRRARGVGRRRAAPRRAARRRHRRQRRRRHRRRRAAVPRVLHRRSEARSRPYAIPVSIVGMVSSEISIALRLHGISHVLSTGCTSSTDAIGYALVADPRRRSRRAAVGRRRRLRHAGHDLRLLAHAGHVDALQRHAGGPRRGRSIAAATASCSARAPGCSCSSARNARGRAARRSTPSVDGYGSTCDAYHRVQMDPDGGEIVRAMRMAIERAGRPRREHRLRQLSRHLDAAERRGRSRAA